jgi:hypothetical protein
MARNAGPVINEVIVQMGPDPEVVPPVTGQEVPANSPTPAWLQRIQTAVATLNDAQKRFLAITATPGTAAVLTPLKAAMDAAGGALADSASLNTSTTAAALAAAKASIDKRVTDTAKGAADAATALETLAIANAAAPDFAAATGIAKIAQDAAKAVQDIQAALLTATPVSPTAASSTRFGLLELRGRMLSQDATFKISIDADAKEDDFQLAFDRLEPSPADDKHLQKPRLLERDPDASSDTLAKRLLLVVRLDAKTTPFFAEKTMHTLTVTTPDSQKVVFKYTVPESQKPS